MSVPNFAHPNDIHSLFDPITNTVTYVVWNRRTRDAVVIDPLMDFDPVTRRTLPWSCHAVRHFVRAKNLRVHWLLETHAHADHLSASRSLRATLPGSRWAMSEAIGQVFDAFHEEWEWPDTVSLEDLRVDRFLRDGEELAAGELRIKVIGTPGHTPACVTYQIGNWVFVGDALMTPDSGTGRCDFPGGDASRLYTSIWGTLYALDPAVTVFSGHDYQPGGRPPRAGWPLAAHLRGNIHLNAATTRADFVAFRTRRDANLNPPRLLPPSLDWNLGAHQLVRPSTDDLIDWF